MNKITNKICSILLVCLLSGCGNNNSTSSLSSSSSDISSSTLSSEESSSKNEKVKISYEEFLGYVYKKYDDNSYNHINLTTVEVSPNKNITTTYEYHKNDNNEYVPMNGETISLSRLLPVQKISDLVYEVESINSLGNPSYYKDGDVISFEAKIDGRYYAMKFNSYGLIEYYCEKYNNQNYEVNVSYTYKFINNPTTPEIKDKDIEIWVGAELASFYQDVLNNYRRDMNLDYNFKVIAHDSGNNAEILLNEKEKAADILVVPHDNLCKLTEGDSAIMPINDEALLAQIDEENLDMFKEVIKSDKNGITYTYGAPFQSQSLFLYYNKAVVSEEQAKTFEGLAEAAKNASTSNNKVRACTFLGNDGYNFSWSILARQMPGNTSTLKLYENKKAENCYFQGDDMVAVTKWAQDYFDLENGASYPSSSGWEMELTPKQGAKAGKAVALIGGAWNLSRVQSVLGTENVGIAKLPTFTTKEAYGSIPAETTFQAGAFFDCKMFVMNKMSNHKDIIQDIVRFLSSKEIQEEAFKECGILPAYKNAQTEFASMKENTISAQLAIAQLSIAKHAIPQPFGNGEYFNQYYYSGGTADLYKSLIENDDNEFSTYEKIKYELANIENIWKTGNRLR